MRKREGQKEERERSFECALTSSETSSFLSYAIGASNVCVLRTVWVGVRIGGQVRRKGDGECELTKTNFCFFPTMIPEFLNPAATAVDNWERERELPMLLGSCRCNCLTNFWALARPLHTTCNTNGSNLKNVYPNPRE